MAVVFTRQNTSRPGGGITRIDLCVPVSGDLWLVFVKAYGRAMTKIAIWVEACNSNNNEVGYKRILKKWKQDIQPFKPIGLTRLSITIWEDVLPYLQSN